jgi:hypothetical protein
MADRSPDFDHTMQRNPSADQPAAPDETPGHGSWQALDCYPETGESVQVRLNNESVMGAVWTGKAWQRGRSELSPVIAWRRIVPLSAHPFPDRGPTTA